MMRTVVAAAAVAALVPSARAAQITGPSSSQPPYLERVEPGVVVKSILTVGDSVNPKPDGTPYRMVGIPDGLGAFDNGDGTFTLLMNHELGGALGIVRAHGAKGAFVSRWTIRKDDLAVVRGEDLIQQIATWDAASHAHAAPAKGVVLSRLCSADLPPSSAFFDAATGAGTTERIFMDGEESGIEGRGFAHLLDGTSYELPSLGKFSWENSVAHPDAGAATVVVGLDDGTGGQVYAYRGQKTTSGSPVERAGLTNGRLYGIKVDGLDAETNATALAGPVTFTTYDHGDVSSMTGAQLEAESKDPTGAFRVTTFQRPEDGAWDPGNPSDFYFVTTASFTGNSRLWRLRFDDPTNPGAGGTIELLLDGTEGPKMMDNLTINHRGQLLIQEDPGNQAHLAKVWRYDTATGALEIVLQHDPERFEPGAAGFLTQDEESSGIVPAPFLGEGWYLADVQAHHGLGGELVEGGQLVAIEVPPGRPVGGRK